MRDLFVSEARFIQNMLLRDGAERVQIPEQVIIEYYAPPQAGSANAFNADFILQFVETDDLRDFRSFSCPVRPNTMGAEVFLTVDKKTGGPLCAQLIAGEAFESEYFSDEIERIEREVSLSGINVNLVRSKYVRILVFKNEFCFLVFPDDAEPTLYGERVVLVDGTESSILSHMTDGRLICLDGWIKAEIADSDWFLVAEPKDED